MNDTNANPAGHDLSRAEIEELLNGGYRLRLTKSRKMVCAESKATLSYPLFPSVRVAGREDGWNMLTMHVAFDGDGTCVFKTYAEGVFAIGEVSAVILSNVPKDEFDTWRSVTLARLRENGMADSSSSIGGSVMYLRGRGIAASGFITDVWPGWLAFFRETEEFFHSLDDFTDLGIVNACNNYLIKRKEQL